MKRVSAVMHKHVVGVASTARVSTALMVMRHAKVSVAPVLGNGKLVGLLTREIAIEKGNSGKTVDEVMLNPGALIDMKMAIEDAARILIKSRLSRLPVVENRRSMNVVGTVTATEIVKALKN